MMEPSVTDWISAYSSLFSTIISLCILFIAWFQIKQVRVQLKNLEESQRNSTLMTVLELESELNKRKEYFDQCSFEVRQYNIDINLRGENPNSDSLELLQDKIKVSRENYLNALDRLSYCILHKYLLDRDWKTEYRDVIFEVVDNFSECFGVSSRFRSIKKIYEKWKNE
ncbi:hypothetical protein CHU92_07355 [Flavobacterium cyanobacteriorum]|uniref:DUF4760 domain-containing protein n=1 Tax=Flavobacterium cyanobacteriorum TaxID=2022802 RepID=A0A255Z8W0_9FLAO|nr:hypothetical protein [Flavobacterium cyanobacteriorum]OYQ37851.1 hypothetical protein CHU92_07355 [Flavobacterium cyanobacteriorum]